MTESEWIAFISGMDKVQTSENYGYTFFHIGDDNMLPFATIAHKDNEYETLSNLSREGVFRLNIGISRNTFKSLFADSDSKNIDYTQLNVFMPHPDYAKQNFLCILNPANENLNNTRELLREAYALAMRRYERKTKS